MGGTPILGRMTNPSRNPDAEGVLRAATSAVTERVADLPEPVALARQVEKTGDAVLAAWNDEDDSPFFSLPPDPRIDPIRLLDLLRSEALVRCRESRDLWEPDDTLRLVRAFERVGGRIRQAEDGLLGAPVLDPYAREIVREIAHTLRSPLGSIVFLVDALRSGQSGPVTDLQRTQLGIVYRASLSLSEMLNGLVELSAPRPGEEPPEEPGGASLSSVLQEVENALRPVAEEKQIELQVVGPEAAVPVGGPALAGVLLPLSLVLMGAGGEGVLRIEGESGGGGSGLLLEIRRRGDELSRMRWDELESIFRSEAEDERFGVASEGIAFAAVRRRLRRLGGTLDVGGKTEESTFVVRVRIRG